MAFATILNQIRFLDLQFEIFQLNGIPLKKEIKNDDESTNRQTVRKSKFNGCVGNSTLLLYIVFFLRSLIISEPFTMFHLIPKSPNAMKVYFSVSRI